MDQNKDEQNRQEPMDDGRTIVDMNVEGFPWYRPHKADDKKKKNDPDRPTGKELRAMILAAYKAYLPSFLIMLGAFVLMFLLAYFWLR